MAWKSHRRLSKNRRLKLPSSEPRVTWRDSTTLELSSRSLARRTNLYDRKSRVNVRKLLYRLIFVIPDVVFVILEQSRSNSETNESSWTTIALELGQFGFGLYITGSLASSAIAIAIAARWLPRLSQQLERQCTDVKRRATLWERSLARPRKRRGQAQITRRLLEIR